MKAILLTILFLTVYGCSMAQDKVLEKATKCYVIRKIVPQARVDIGDVKLEKFVLYDICLGEKSDEKEKVFIIENGITNSVKAKLIKTFENGIAAQKFAADNKITDTEFAKTADCQIIRLINLPMSLMGKKVENAKPEIALLNTCIMREKVWEVLPKIKLTRNGKEIEREFWDMRAFKNQTEAEEYAKQNGLTDVNFTENISNMKQNNQSNCYIIRIVGIPMTKRPGVQRELKIALLNTCLKDKIPQQRPVIEVIRNGEKAFREFEIIKLFADKAEAENYAKENNLDDVNYNDKSDLGKLDAELTKQHLDTMRGDISDEVIKLKNEFKETLKTALKNPETFDYPFFNLANELTIRTSPDKKLKIYSWDTHTGGTMHFFSVIAQYKRADDTVGIEELGNELPSQNDFSIYEIYEIEAKNKKYYLTFGWGTHGGGHQFNIVQVFRIEKDLLIKDNSILPNKRDLVITYLRSEKSELAFDSAKNEISYREFVEDKDSGFMKATGKKIMINLGDKNTTNPTNYIVFDGSRNKYIITENSLEYIPITPAKSSSGVYSGGEYVKKSLTADEYKSIVALLAKAMENQEIQTDVRAKGNPIIEFNQKTYILKMNAEIAQGVVKMLKDLRQPK